MIFRPDPLPRGPAGSLPTPYQETNMPHVIEPLALPAMRQHTGLYLGPRHAKPVTDDVILQVAQRTTGGGASILLDVADVSRAVCWLVAATGQDPKVEGYGSRRQAPGPVLNPFVAVARYGDYADVLTLYVADGEVVASVQHFATDFGNAGPQGTTRLTIVQSGQLRDWLAAWHLHGWPGVPRAGAGEPAAVTR